MRARYSTDETIAALASAAGPAARGIVRVSGPKAVAIVASCVRLAEGSDLGALRAAAAVSGQVMIADSPIKQVAAELYVWPGAKSYTRQPMVEIHLPGSGPLLSAVLKTLCASGARMAEPGEFTLRSFLAGRVDLTQAEAVLGVIDAQTGKQLETALAQLAGGLARPLRQLREQLLDLLAHLEAGLDFVEEDIEFVTRSRVADSLDRAIQVVEGLREKMASRHRSDALLRVVLRGWPNVGKSSLFNALVAGHSLVADQPGTTRDYLSATLDLDGIKCRLVDTAGIAPGASPDSIDAAASRLASAQVDAGDISLLCLDATRPLNEWERRQLADKSNGAQLLLWTKCDRVERIDGHPPAIETSAVERRGLEQLRLALKHALTASDHSEATARLTAERCAQSIAAALVALWRAAELNAEGAGEELVAAELLLALDELGRVVGEIYTDDILDRIFGRFCIGK